MLAPTVLLGWATVYGAFTSALVQVSQGLLLFSFFVSVAFRVGWVHRLMVWSCERELRRALNGTPVTVGSLRVDLLRGRAWLSNIILHAPRREAWRWQSPVQARVGKLYVECNLVLCLLSLWFLWEERPIDVATVEASDIQGFVERKNNVFNFYLMDPHIDVPDPPVDVDDDNGDDNEHLSGPQHRVGAHESNAAQQQAPFEASTSALPIDPASAQPRNHPGSTLSADGGAGPLEEPAATQLEEASAASAAQKLVDDMVRALGRATQRGSFHAALAESRERIKTELKALQKNKSKAGAMQEGVKIVQQVSKSIVEKSQNVPNVVFPTRRHGFKGKTVYGRIGRVVLRDLRVFTRDHHFDRRKSKPAGGGAGASTGDDCHSDPDEEMDTTSVPTWDGAWNRPIWLEKVTLRAAELCPPLSSKDKDGLPLVFQPLDRSFEIIWKRVLTEIAKSNTGAFFQTAVGEVLDFYMDTTKSSTATAAASGGSAILEHSS
jgi:hypothetical protein